MNAGDGKGQRGMRQSMGYWLFHASYLLALQIMN
jgi:hypothetical protein